MELQELYKKLVETLEYKREYELTELIDDLTQFQGVFNNPRYNQYFDAAISECNRALKVIARDFPDDVRERGLQYVANVQAELISSYVNWILRSTK